MREYDPRFPRNFIYFRRLIRAHEFAENQTVSMMDVFGKNRGLRRAAALWRIGIDTCDKLLDTKTDEIVEQLSVQERIPDDVEQARAMVDGWKKKILSVRADREASTESSKPTDSKGS